MAAGRVGRFCGCLPGPRRAQIRRFCSDADPVNAAASGGRPARAGKGEPMRTSISLTATLAAVLLAAAATFPAAAQDADWDKVVAAAKQEGKVVVYNSAN